MKPLFLSFLFLLSISALSHDVGLYDADLFKDNDNLRIQQKQVTGTVTDIYGEPVIGATVLIKGSNRGTVTDASGNYILPGVAEKDLLQFSFVGMVTQVIEVGSQEVINVVLEQDDIGIDEVVVVGYSELRKVDVTGAVASLNSEDLMQTQPVTIESALKGKVSGVQVRNTDGAPGSGIVIKIRGASSITAGSSPLYVIDGFPVPVSDDPADNPLSKLSPESIESISILKDVSSTAIYGSQGANGVVLITTKKGKEGQSEISFKATTGISNILNAYEMLDNKGYMQAYMLEQVMTRRWDNADLYPEYRDQVWETNPSRFTDYQELCMRTARRNLYELSFLGGSKNIQNSTSLSYLDDQGIAIKTGFKRYVFNSNTTYQVLPNLKFNTLLSYENSDREGMHWDLNGNGGIFNEIVGFSPLIPKEWTFLEIDENLYYTGRMDNPYRKLNDIELLDNRSQFSGQFRADLRISDHINLAAFAGVRTPKNEYRKFVPKTIQSSYVNNGQATYFSQEGLNLRTGLHLNYHKLINQVHDVRIGAIWEINSYETESFKEEYTNFNTDLGWYGIYSAESGSFVTPPELQHYKYDVVSGVIFGNYSYKGKYLFKASLRSDASSKFGPNNRWGFFPSFATGWRISEEEFFSASPVSNVVSYAKLRGSAGIVGNDQINPYIYANTLRAFERSGVFGTISGPGPGGILNTAPNSILALYTARMANREVAWETSGEINLGLDFGFFKNRLLLTIDAYNKYTYNMLLNRNLPMITGFDEITQNVGSVRNRGLEFSLNGAVVKTAKFNWSAAFNISTNRSKILSLGGEEQMLENRYVGHTNSEENVLLKVGYPLGVLYGLQIEGIRSNYTIDNNAPQSLWWYNNQREAPYGFVSFADINGDGTTNLEDRTAIAFVEPRFIGGFSQNFRYGIFDLTMDFSYSYGNDIINGNFYQLMHQNQSINNKLSTYLETAWFANNTDGTYPGPGAIYWMGYQRDATNSEIVEDGSFLKMNSLAIGVSLPNSLSTRLKIQSAKLTYSLSNLFTLTKYSGYDPEVSSGSSIDNRILSGVDYSSYPYARTHSLTIHLKF